MIAELEPTAREVYTGSIGYASPLAGLELNVAIRTLELREADSGLAPAGGSSPTPTRAASSTRRSPKARPIAAAVGSSVRVGEPPPTTWRAGPRPTVAA